MTPNNYQRKSENFFINKKFKKKALAIGIGIVDQQTIDDVNIYEANEISDDPSGRKIVHCTKLFVDRCDDLGFAYSAGKIIKGDARSVSIAAASIIAKVYRDQLMKEYDVLYPGYGFSHNAGYGTKEHLEGLERQGITPIHRKVLHL